VSVKVRISVGKATEADLFCPGESENNIKISAGIDLFIGKE